MDSDWKEREIRRIQEKFGSSNQNILKARIKEIIDLNKGWTLRFGNLAKINKLKQGFGIKHQVSADWRLRNFSHDHRRRIKSNNPIHWNLAENIAACVRNLPGKHVDTTIVITYE